MNNVYLDNHSQLKDIFGIDRLSNKYIEYTPLIDRKVGFSVKREYPANIRYLSPKTKDGKSDTVALIYVVYNYPTESSKETKNNKIPIFLSITPYSRYLSNHFDYDFNDDKCPTEDSVQRSKSTPKPISLESLDEYVYDHGTNVLRDSKNSILSGEQILDKLFQEHCDTVHLFKGLTLRWKIGSQNIIVKICDFLVQIGKWLLKILFGRTFEPKDPFSGSLKIYLKEDMKLLKTEAVDVFGYKASKNVIITFAWLVLIGYFILYRFPIKSQFIHDLTSNNLLTLCFSLAILSLLDHFCPALMLYVINWLLKIKIKILFLRFKT